MRQPEKPFVQLYHEALRDKTLSAEARFLGVLFASYANRERLAYPGTPLLMNLTGWGERKVKQARAELVRRGWLEKDFLRGQRGRFERHPGSRDGRAVRYLVSLKLLRREAAKDSTAGAENALTVK